MSYTVVASEPKRRPSVVTAAVALLYLVAALQLVAIALSATSLGPIRDVYQDEYAGTELEDVMATSVTIGIVVGLVVSVLFAAVFVVLAMLDGRGKNPARIVTWVIGGIGVLCYGCTVASSGLSGAFTGFGADTNQSGLPDPDEVARRVEAAIPSWQGTVSLINSVILLVALVAVIILLALPASNAFFRKESEVWVPPTQWPAGGPPGGAPGATGYPDYPGTPPPGSPGAPGSSGFPPAPPAGS